MTPYQKRQARLAGAVLAAVAAALGGLLDWSTTTTQILGAVLIGISLLITSKAND